MDDVASERKAMLLLRTLHKRGFGRLRFSSGMSPSGLHWRYAIAPVQVFNPDGMTLNWELDLASLSVRTSSDGESPPFDWRGAEGASQEVFADWFEKRFPAVVEAGRGEDAAYVAWYERVLELTAPEGLLVMYGDDHDPERDGIHVLRLKRKVEIPLPPRLAASE